MADPTMCCGDCHQRIEACDCNATPDRAANPILPPNDVLRAMAGQIMAEFGPDVCGADMVSALTARECQEWLRGLRDG